MITKKIKITSTLLVVFYLSFCALIHANTIGADNYKTVLNKLGFKNTTTAIGYDPSTGLFTGYNQKGNVTQVKESSKVAKFIEGVLETIGDVIAPKMYAQDTDEVKYWKTEGNWPADAQEVTNSDVNPMDMNVMLAYWQNQGSNFADKSIYFQDGTGNTLQDFWDAFDNLTEGQKDLIIPGYEALRDGIPGNGEIMVIQNTDYSGNDELPVELTTFNASIDDFVTLDWATATEVNNYGYFVEREIVDKEGNVKDARKDLETFIPGHGNSNSPKEYSWTDSSLTSIAKDDTVKYWLKQMDTDGTTEYFGPAIAVGQGVIANQREGIPTEFAISRAFPNPFNPETSVKYNLERDAHVNITVYDSNGEKVREIINQNQNEGVYRQRINMGSELASGIYFADVVITPDGGQPIRQARKLMLLK